MNYIRILTTTVLIFLFSLPGLPGKSASGKTFNVTVVNDTVDKSPGDGKCADAIGNCSLRAAIMEANVRAGSDLINLPADTFRLKITGVDEDDAASGDLDIIGELTINGSGKNNSIIDAFDLDDRVFDIQAGALVDLNYLTIQNGDADSAISDNGGGIQNQGVLKLTNSFVFGNYGDEGGGIYNIGEVVITGSEISGNQARLGGGISNEAGTAAINNSTIIGNQADYGGGIHNRGSMTLHYSSVDNNKGYGYGGIDNEQGSMLQVFHSTISGNISFEYVGGLSNRGEAYIIGSTFSGNTARYRAGALYNAEGYTYLVNSTISANKACDSGGGVLVFSGGLEAYNTTIVNNLANLGVLIENCDNFGLNPSSTGGGISQAGGHVHLYNSIIANNKRVNDKGVEVDDDCGGILETLSFSLLSTSDGCTFSNKSSITGQKPGLRPLSNNGGFTQTHALKQDSPTIDAGDPAGCKDKDGNPITTDQRGYPRPFDGDKNGSDICDIGAYEYVDFLPYSYLPILNK